MELYSKSASELATMLKNKQCSSSEITASLLNRIESENEKLNCFITVIKESALENAKAVDQKRADGESLPALAGVPIAIKDNIATKGLLTSCGSKMLANFIAPYNATVVDNINKNYMINLGKLNMDELAIGTSGETSYFGATLNPWNEKYTPGGSSSGSASAVAAGLVPLALGTDTGGSIRVPAAYCGIVGLKPTYGAVSRYGAVAVGSSFDQIGPIGRTVEDVALLYNVIKGHDPKDAVSFDQLGDVSTTLNKPLTGLKIGVMSVSIKESDGEVAEAVTAAAKALEKQGATLVELSMPSTEYSLSAYYILSSAEISSNMGRFDGVRYGFRAEGYTDLDELFIMSRSQGLGAEVQRRIMYGTYVLSKETHDAYYRRAKEVQKLIKNDFAEAFKSCDIIITPTAAKTAFKMGQALKNPADTYATDSMTTPANLAGLPAVSIPCGIGKNNLPIGLQLIGQHNQEGLILNVAYMYQQLVGGFPTIYSVRGNI